MKLLITTAASLALAGTVLGACETHSFTSCEDNIVHWFDPRNGIVCDPLDCGGGRAPPKTDEPCCAAYKGTEPCVSTTSTLSCWTPSSVSASSTASESEEEPTATDKSSPAETTASETGGTDTETSAETSADMSNTTAPTTTNPPTQTATQTSSGAASETAESETPASSGTESGTALPSSTGGAGAVGGSLVAVAGAAIAVILEY